jgi:hypothetical protein
MLRFFILSASLALYSCSTEEKTIPANLLITNSNHVFSNDNDEDRFALRFLPSDSGLIKSEYTYFDILSGKLSLTIYSPDEEVIYQHLWAVSDCFSMADNHYLNEEQKIAKFLDTFRHFFDAKNFNTIGDLRITGVLRSADLVYQREIEGDPESIGFSFIQEDFCVMYARKSRRAVLLRALRKDILRNYNLAHQHARADLPFAQ